MQIESIQLSGFRTFAEPTTIKFHPGVTCIIGPDGCGKSNVLESMRWAVACELVDERFRGTEVRPPAVSASVALELVGVDWRVRYVRTIDADGNDASDLPPRGVDRETISSEIQFVDDVAEIETDSNKILVFDEPESALSSEEIESFGEQLAQLAENHQIIVATHSRTFMSCADAVIGVTWLENGVSSLMRH